MASRETGSSRMELKQVQFLSEILDNEIIGEFSLEHF
jgi:hypothetical protein